MLLFQAFSGFPEKITPELGQPDPKEEKSTKYKELVKQSGPLLTSTRRL